jgi:hypothetical protein
MSCASLRRRLADFFQDGRRFEAGGVQLFEGKKLAHGQVFQRKFMYRKAIFLYKCTFKRA